MIWQELTNLAIRKNSSAPRLRLASLNVVFPLISLSVGVGCLSQGKGGAKRRNEVNREPYLTDTWGHSFQSA